MGVWLGYATEYEWIFRYHKIKQNAIGEGCFYLQMLMRQTPQKHDWKAEPNSEHFSGKPKWTELLGCTPMLPFGCDSA